MEIIPFIHLEEWEKENISPDIISYQKGKLKIIDRNKELHLYISDINNNFNKIKIINNYWELKSLDIFLNDNIISDADNAQYQIDFMKHIRDSFCNYEYIILNNNTNYIFSVNNLFDINDKWNDNNLKEMWNNKEISVLSLLDDIDPKILTNKGWEDLNINDISDISNRRETSILNLLN